MSRGGGWPTPHPAGAPTFERCRALVAALLCAGVAGLAAAADPLPSATGQAIAADTRRMLDDDARIAAAVSIVLARAPAIPDIGVDVNSRVVTLSGVVANDRLRLRAGRLAQGVQGVREVDNALQVDTALGTRLREGWNDLVAQGQQLLAKLPLLVIGALVIWLAFMASGWAASAVRRMRLHISNPYVQTLLSRAVRVAVLAAGVVVALELLGATTIVGAVLGSAGVAGIALGFAFRDVAENYIAGAMLSLRQPFSPGDRIEINGKIGRVVALNARATLLMTEDGNHLRIPNAEIFKASIVNYTQSPKRRLLFQVDLDATASLTEAERAGLAAIGKVGGVLPQPPAEMAVVSHGSAGTVVEFTAWIDQSRNDFGRARSAAVFAVKGAFDAARIPLARQIRYEAPLDAVPPPSGEDHPASKDTSVDEAGLRRVEEARREAPQDLLREGATKE